MNIDTLDLVHDAIPAGELPEGLALGDQYGCTLAAFSARCYRISLEGIDRGQEKTEQQDLSMDPIPAMQGWEWGYHKHD